MTKAVLSIILCGILCAGFVGWRVHVHANQVPIHVEIVLDPSLSHSEGCESLVGLAEQSFRADGLSRDSTLTVLVLGDASTANEPWQLGRYAVPVTSKVLEGKTANMRREAGLLSDIQRKCETVRRTSETSWRGVREAAPKRIAAAHLCIANPQNRVEYP